MMKGNFFGFTDMTQQYNIPVSELYKKGSKKNERAKKKSLISAGEEVVSNAKEQVKTYESEFPSMSKLTKPLPVIQKTAIAAAANFLLNDTSDSGSSTPANSLESGEGASLLEKEKNTRVGDLLAQGADKLKTEESTEQQKEEEKKEGSNLKQREEVRIEEPKTQEMVRENNSKKQAKAEEYKSQEKEESKPELNVDVKQEAKIEEPKPQEKEETKIESALLSSIKTKKVTGVQEQIFAASISDLLAEESFLPSALSTFTEYNDRVKILDSILDRILIAKSHPKEEKESLNNGDDTSGIDILHANCLIKKTEYFLDKSEGKEVEKDTSLGFVNDLEEANKLYESLLKNTEKNNQGSIFKNISNIQKQISKLALSYEYLKDQISIAKHSLEIRSENFGKDSQQVLTSLSMLSKLCADDLNHNYFLEGLQYSEAAYNIVFSSKNLNSVPKESLLLVVDLLSQMEKIYKVLGDNNKSNQLLGEVVYLKSAISSQEKEQNLLDSKIETQDQASLILKKGITDSNVFELKKSIQEAVLKPICAAASTDKWYNNTVFGQYGVVGYVEKGFLKQSLGVLYNEENYKIALGLCFEAICLGVKNGAKSPLVAAIFCEKHPQIAQYVIENHPEYFVDGSIFKAVIKNASDYSKSLLGYEVGKNEYEYNKLLEDAITPAISERIEGSILKPIEEIVKKGDWSASIQSYFEHYLSSENIKSCLGNNLSQIEDAVNISRMLAFKSMNAGFKESSVKNITSFQKFIEKYSDLNVRIIRDHKDCIHNEENSPIIHQCKIAQTEFLKKVEEKKTSKDVNATKEATTGECSAQKGQDQSAVTDDAEEMVILGTAPDLSDAMS